MQKLFDAFKHNITRIKRNEKAYRPSAVQYDSKKLQAIFYELPREQLDCSEEEMIKVVNFLKVSDAYHDYCVQFLNYLRTNLKCFNMKGEDIIEFFIAALNRDFKVVTAKMRAAQDSRPEKEKYLFQDMTNPRISMQDGRSVEVKSGMEALTDGVNQICNIIRHFLTDDFLNDEANPEYLVGYVLQINAEANKFEVFKSAYDDILYNGGYVNYNPRSDSFAFDYDSHNELKLLKAGIMIIQERISKFYQQNIINPKKTPFDNYIANYRVKRVKMENGFVKLDFGGGDPRNHRDVASEFYAAMEAYYQFLELDMELDCQVPLKLIEALAVWSALRYICHEVLDRVNCDVAMNSKEEMEAIPRRFLKEDLIAYVSRLTGIKPYKAKVALELFEVNWNTINDIWTAPLYRVKNYYSIPFYPVMNCVQYNVIEHIIGRDEEKLKERGKIFEKFVYDEINNFPHRFYVKCLDSRLYGEKRKGGEEIDLIVELKDLIILAEMKCIHYSMEPGEYADAWLRLEDGAKQAKRKATFMKNNPDLFRELGDISKKRILPIVVTNYPTFTGFEYEGVYVIDEHSFVSYINVGNMTLTEFSKDSMRLAREKRFYTNEIECSMNFEQYLKKNPVKSIYTAKMTIEDIPLVDSDKPWKFSTKTTVYRGDPGFDISNIIPS